MKDFKKKTKNKSIKKYRTCKKKDIQCQKELVLDLLRDTPFPKNVSRKNIMRTKHKENKARYEGFVLGKINLIPHMWKKNTQGKTVKQQDSNRTKDPRFKKLFTECKKLMKMHDPKFEFTTIQYMQIRLRIKLYLQLDIPQEN